MKRWSIAEEPLVMLVFKDITHLKQFIIAQLYVAEDCCRCLWDKVMVVKKDTAML